jgi:hypothetical protein
MAIRAPCVIVLIFLIVSFAFAQNNESGSSESPSYFIRETEEGAQFIQKIEWTPMDGILRYEMILERRNANGSYEEYLQEMTEEAFLEVSIPAGNYRYKVLGYNVLNRLGAESAYHSFEVFQALQPLIRNISPNQLFLDGDLFQATLMGEHLLQDESSEIYLVPIKRNKTDNSSNQPGVIFPSLIYSDSGDTVEMIFDKENLPADSFRIVVVNPGGLRSVYESFQIKRFIKPMDFSISAGYAPLIPFYPFEHSSASHISNILEKTFYPLGFMARISFVPFKTQFGFFGFELSPFFSRIETEKDTYTIKTNILNASLSLLYQIPFFKEKFFLNMRIGGGIASYAAMTLEYEDGVSSDSLLTLFPEAQAGISGQLFVWSQAFIDLGMDFKFFFAKDMFTIYMNPAISVGWRF